MGGLARQEMELSMGGVDGLDPMQLSHMGADDGAEQHREGRDIHDDSVQNTFQVL